MGRSIDVGNTEDSLDIPEGLLPALAEEPWWSSDDGGGGGAGVKASLACASLAALHFDTVVQAMTEGVDGNIISLQLIGDSAGGAGVAIDVVYSYDGDGVLTGIAVTIHYESGVSTVANVEAAITALLGPDAVIAVKTAGTGATVLTAVGDDFVATLLTGGSTLGRGHMVQGHHIDSILIDFQVTNWDAVQDIQLIVQRSPEPERPANRWSQVIPDSPLNVPLLFNATALGTGRFTVKVPVEGAKAVRFGFRANDGGAKTVFALNARAEYLASSVYA